MFYNVQRLINEIVPDEPDPAAANALQEGLGHVALLKRVLQRVV